MPTSIGGKVLIFVFFPICIAMSTYTDSITYIRTLTPLPVTF